MMIMSCRSVEAALALAVIAFLHLPFCSEASYSLSIRAHRYWNPDHQLADGSCCDGWGSSNCGNECDNRFKFCLRRYGTNRDGNENNCPLRSYSTGEIGDDGFSFGSSWIASGVPNPMILRGNIWEGGLQMFVTIIDVDGFLNDDDHVDDVYAEVRLSPGQPLPEREYVGSRSNSHITFSFSISCDSNFYGSDCTTYCVPTDNNQGHYSCDSSTGQKRCRTGWTDPNNDCLTPVCATNCHVVGGYCNTPGQCLCRSNYYGSDCATYCVPTDNNQGHYWCDSSTGQKRCRPGWTDPDTNCLTPVCATNCHVVGGYCNAPGQCLCHEGWSGSSCDQCQLRPGCSAVGGYCDVPGECICRDYYSGAHCEVDLIPCQRGEYPCSNDAPCINDGVGGYMCHCPAGWTGTHCGEEINECDPNPCHGGSSCVDEVAGFTCVCTDGFEGEYCHIDIDDCESSPCQNSGTCVDRPNGFLCLCSTGYEGTVCESNHDDCTPYPCENGGTCHDLMGGYECDCEVGWTGDRCQVDIDDCVSTPCQNGGSCYDEVDGYVCVCQSGWYGDDCHLEVNECESNPCRNGATCMDLLDSYNCSCAPDYYGDHCQDQYDDCLSEPCLNQGTCTDLINNYTCECHTDFTGANCEINLNPCSSSPCQNGGMCTRDVVNGYVCVCQSGWYGDDCHLEVNECESNPCRNGASCMDLLDSYNCSCAPDYYGDHCQYQYDDCLSEPCQNQGTCEDRVNSYTCACHTDFTGANCEINLNPCSSNPCQNGGTCMRHDNGYACICPPDYTDYNCTATIDIGISSPNRVEVKKYVGSAVPSGSLLIIILIVAMVIITLVCHHKRKRVPILPPPSLPMDDGIETDKVVEKGVPMETSTHSEPEHHVYEDPTTYEIPVKVNPDGEKVSVSIDATTGSTEN